MADIKLKHQVFEADTTLYFYDGELPVKDGVVTIPHGNTVWASNAWLRGYRINPDTGQEYLPIEVQELVTAESSEEKDADEGADVGRQPVSEDGVRTSEQPRDGGVPASRTRSRSRNRPAD